jgi:hypothetical protein
VLAISQESRMPGGLHYKLARPYYYKVFSDIVIEQDLTSRKFRLWRWLCKNNLVD